jgi:hypothetical protein
MLVLATRYGLVGENSLTLTGSQEVTETEQGLPNPGGVTENSPGLSVIRRSEAKSDSDTPSTAHQFFSGTPKLFQKACTRTSQTRQNHSRDLIKRIRNAYRPNHSGLGRNARLRSSISLYLKTPTFFRGKEILNNISLMEETYR